MLEFDFREFLNDIHCDLEHLISFWLKAWFILLTNAKLADIGFKLLR